MKFTVPSICNFLRQSALADTMEGSGVHAFFVRLWFRLATDERCEEWPDGFCGTGFNNSVPTEPNPIREQVIAPLGGEVNVAKAAVCHLRNAMCSMDRGEEESLFSFQTVLVIPRLAIVPELAYALLAQNAIRHVTRAMLAFATLPPTGLQTDAPSASLSYVTSNIAFTDSITWATQALNAGILIVLLRYETLYTSSDPYITRRNVQLLEEILPRYLIFLSVVQSARKAVKKAKKSGAANGISRSSDVWAAWVLFGYLVEQRVELAGRSARQKNVCNRCGRIEPKRRAFRQCSGCTDLYYCSSDCQRHDWDAQHRQDCKKIQRNRRGIFA
ncbi:hypothetical protein B0H16DRAFT_969990 [Mycena metata]|uniref:MYND-type domain-containing protein n=1 Tax=Mycena metata TaxID=1033252 RepID=A0AAD7ILN3_9AGAR|nr:hypothetical protein B0H16DRAFT_969990 [Mycena metata]